MLFPQGPRVSVGMATCGLAAGAGAVFDALRQAADKLGFDLTLVATGCIGYCQEEPLVDVTYARTLAGSCTPKMTPERARKLIAVPWHPVNCRHETRFGILSLKKIQTSRKRQRPSPDYPR